MLDRENFFSIGAKAGVNINKITGQSYKAGFNYNYFLGGFMQFNFSKTFGFSRKLILYNLRRSFLMMRLMCMMIIFRDGSQRKAKLNYLKVPLLLNINVGPSKRVKLQVGPQVGGLLNQTIDSLINQP